MQLYLALSNQAIVHCITKIKLNFVSLSLSLSIVFAFFGYFTHAQYVYVRQC